MKNVFYWFVSLFFCFVSQRCLANTAASKLAERIYLLGTQSLEAKKWFQALWAFEMASLLDPDLEAAKAKQERWERFLEENAHQEYEAGLEAFQNKKSEEAKLHWRLALTSLLDKDHPLYSKIEKALTMEDVLSSMTMAHLTEEGAEREERRQKMMAVKESLDKGEMAQAVLSLEEILYKYPNNERAKKLLSSLKEKQKGETNLDLSEDIQKNFEEAQKKFSLAKEVLQKKNALLAYRNYLEAQNLFGEGDLKPPFYLELLNQKREVEEILKKEMGPTLDLFEKNLASPSPDLKAIGSKLREFGKNYPPLAKVKELLDKVYGMLQADALPSLMRVKTIQELEGCKKAIDRFEEVKAAALFSEVPAWQEAQKNIEVCKKSGGHKN